MDLRLNVKRKREKSIERGICIRKATSNSKFPFNCRKSNWHSVRWWQPLTNLSLCHSGVGFPPLAAHWPMWLLRQLPSEAATVGHRDNIRRCVKSLAEAPIDINIHKELLYITSWNQTGTASITVDINIILSWKLWLFYSYCLHLSWLISYIIHSLLPLDGHKEEDKLNDQNKVHRGASQFRRCFNWVHHWIPSWWNVPLKTEIEMSFVPIAIPHSQLVKIQ